MVARALFTSDKHDWETPQPFFNRLDKEFGFTLDACATPQNAKCAAYYTIEDDGLAQDWRGVVWVRKAYREALKFHGATVVMLIPSRTDTAYWHEYIINASEIRFVLGAPVISALPAKAI